MKNSLVTPKKQLTTCTNQSIADEFIKRYRVHTQSALENVLCMGEAVFEIYQQVKSGELDKSDLEYFCHTVHLDPKSSTFRKYKAIGENAPRFRQVIDKLPSSFSVLYEMTTLDAEDFEHYVIQFTFDKRLTLEQFKKIINKSHRIKKSNLFTPCALKTPRLQVAKYLQEINLFEITIVRDLHRKDFDEIIDTLTDYKNKGWIKFEIPTVTQYGSDSNTPSETEDEIDDDMKYFQSLADFDAREMRV
jgi:hypothetical protein